MWFFFFPSSLGGSNCAWWFRICMTPNVEDDGSQKATDLLYRSTQRLFCQHKLVCVCVCSFCTLQYWGSCQWQCVVHSLGRPKHGLQHIHKWTWCYNPLCWYGQRSLLLSSCVIHILKPSFHLPINVRLDYEGPSGALFRITCKTNMWNAPTYSTETPSRYLRRNLVADFGHCEGQLFIPILRDRDSLNGLIINFTDLYKATGH